MTYVYNGIHYKIFDKKFDTPIYNSILQTND